MGKKTKITIFSILAVLSAVHIVANVLCFKVLGVDFINSALVGGSWYEPLILWF